MYQKKLHSQLNSNIENYFHRPKEENELKEKISKQKSSYFLLVGERGKGKTSLASGYAQRSRGVIYVSCPPDPLQFGKKFADAIDYSSIYNPIIFRKLFTSLNILPSSSSFNGPLSEFNACQEKFIDAVIQYKKNTGEIPILIIDDVNNFCNQENNKEMLFQLQKLAKKCAVRFIGDFRYSYDLFLKLR